MENQVSYLGRIYNAAVAVLTIHDLKSGCSPVYLRLEHI